MSHDHHGSYYVPEYSAWPILMAVALFILGLGSIEYFGSDTIGPKLLVGGSVFLVGVLTFWLYNVISESRKGLYDEQMHRTFRWGMLWFMFTDTMLFFGLLAALWYYRIFTASQLAGGPHAFETVTHYLLWPDFKATWPLLVNPDPSQFSGPKQGLMIGYKNIITTMVMICSSITLWLANKGLKTNKKYLLNASLISTFIIITLFLILKADALAIAINQWGITLGSGIYGSIIMFMFIIFLLHVAVAYLLLLLIIIRSLMGHFDQNNTFSIRSFSWFWNFLVIIWLLIFLSVY